MVFHNHFKQENRFFLINGFDPNKYHNSMTELIWE